jgi:hypothetical protein
MDGATEFDFSFYVNDVARPDSGRGGDPDRVTESILAKINYRKTINLANAAPRRIDENCLSLNRIDYPLLDPAEPMIVSLDSLDDVIDRHAGSAALSSPVVRLG